MSWEFTYQLVILFLLWRVAAHAKKAYREDAIANRLTAGIDYNE